MILLAVGPGPGTLHVPELSFDLLSAGQEVEVVLEPRAGHFVGPAAFAADAPVVEQATKTPEAIIFAPATTGVLARLARGLVGSGFAGKTYDSGARMVVVAPELDDATAAHAAVRENLALLRTDGCRVVEGVGERMAPPEEIAGAVLNGLGGPLSGLDILVTAGGTREPIDRVRFVGNRSSGKMGRAVAREAWRLGAKVTVVAANVEGIEPGVRWQAVETYAELEEATISLTREADALVMAAAVSDFTPAEVTEGKIRRGGTKELDIRLVATGDILGAVREENPDLFMVGFAATHGDPVPDAREKLASKGANIVVGNDISLSESGFGSDENEVHIVGRDEVRYVARTSKRAVAREILDVLASQIGKERWLRHGGEDGSESGVGARGERR